MRRRPSGWALLLLGAMLAGGPSSGLAQDRPFPYRLTPASSARVGVAATAAASGALGFHLSDRGSPLTAQDVAALDRDDVNALDRGATHNWSTGWQDVSDWSRNAVVAASGLIPFAPLVLGERWSETATLVVIFAEAALLTKGVTEITKYLTDRPRPYLFNTELSVEERLGAAYGPRRARRSFFSGHAAGSFAAATLLSTVYEDLHGPTTTSHIIWVASLGAAALTAYARVEGGLHYPTDVLAGAVVGAAVGRLVPILHRTEGVPVEVAVSPHHIGFRWSLGRSAHPSRH